MYPQVVGEWKVYGQLSGNRRGSDFASAMEQGFRSGGWKGALTKGVEARQTQRKTGYASAYQIAILYADLGDKNKAFRWLNTAYQERDRYLYGLRTDFLLDPLRSDPRFAELVRKGSLDEQACGAVVRKNSIRLPSDRDVGSYLFGIRDLENPRSPLGLQKVPLSLTDPVPS